MSLDETNIQVISTRAPAGSSNEYTINFTIQSSIFSSSSARIMLDANIVDNLKESEKAKAIYDKLVSLFAPQVTEETSRLEETTTTSTTQEPITSTTTTTTNTDKPVETATSTTTSTIEPQKGE